MFDQSTFVMHYMKYNKNRFGYEKFLICIKSNNFLLTSGILFIYICLAQNPLK